MLAFDTVSEVQGALGNVRTVQYFQGKLRNLCLRIRSADKNWTASNIS
jgi:hypothetical protein